MIWPRIPHRVNSLFCKSLQTEVLFTTRLFPLRWGVLRYIKMVLTFKCEISGHSLCTAMKRENNKGTNSKHGTKLQYRSELSYLQYCSIRSSSLLEREHMSSLRLSEDEFTANNSTVLFLALQPDSNLRLMCCTDFLIFISTRGRTIWMVNTPTQGLCYQFSP